MQFRSRSSVLTAALLALMLTIVTACGFTPTPAPTPTSTPNPTPTLEPPVDAFTMNQRLAKTVNLGNALEAPTEGEWGVTLQEDFFLLIKQKGFTAVRLPVRWNAHALKEAPYTIDPEFFKRVDWAVEQALSNDLTIIVNIHHYEEELAVDAAGNQDRFLALWKQIAEHYQAYPNTVLFEPLNEPNGALRGSTWNNLVALTIPVIRASNPTRNLVIGPASWNNLCDLDELKLPADDQHIIVTFHYYNPFQFTHQGAEWVTGSGSWLGTKWGSNADKQMVKFDFDLVQQWADDNKRPIFLGEFGAYSKADMDSRVAWTTYVARQAESHNFSWSYWEFCSGFGLYDLTISQWREPLVQALLPSQ